MRWPTSYCQQSRGQRVFVSVMRRPAQVVVYNAGLGDGAPEQIARAHVQNEAPQASARHTVTLPSTMKPHANSAE